MIWRPLASPATLVALALAGLALCAWGWRRTPHRPARRWGRRAGMLVLLVLMLAGPSVPDQTRQVTSNVEVYFVVDRTGSMGAEDWDGRRERLDGVRADMSSLLDSLGGARYSVITWDSAARVELPVTTDSSAVASFVDALHQEVSEFSAGSSLNRPVDTVLDALRDAKSRHPENVRWLVVFTDGESTDASDAGVSSAWSGVRGLVDGAAVMGYGTRTGGHMRVYRAGGLTDQYMRDTSEPGDPLAVSRIDEGHLRSLAQAVGGQYRHRTRPTSLAPLGRAIMREASRVSEGRRTLSTYRYLVWPAAVGLAGLLAWEAADVAARLRRMRGDHAL